MVSLIYQNHGYEAGGWGVTKGSSLRHGIRLAACRLLADGQGRAGLQSWGVCQVIILYIKTTVETVESGFI